MTQNSASPTVPQDGLEALSRLLDPRSPISAEAARRIRKEIFGDFLISKVEADLLFDLAARVPDSGPAWDELYIEAIQDFVLNQSSPLRSISEQEAAWLIGRFTGMTRALSTADYELILRLFERAEHTPERFQRFAVQAVISLPHARGRVEADDIGRIRRALYAMGSAGGTFITQWEAEALFDLANATATSDNVPEWNDLFARAIGCHVMGLLPRSTSIESEMLAREAWLTAPSDTTGFLSRMLPKSWQNWLTQVGVDPYAEALADAEAHHVALRSAEQVTSIESRWLIERLTKDGTRSPAEAALLAFLEREVPGLPKELKQHAA